MQHYLCCQICSPVAYLLINFLAVQVTDFPHPYPTLRGLNKQILRYKRDDGVMRTANLYTPPGYDAEKDGPLPVFLW